MEKVNNRNPLVSVLMTAFNHEKYISKALNSVLVQKTNFEFELIVGDDCSADDTQKIVEKYKSKNSSIITAINREINFGVINNFIDLFQKTKGKYIALCEGDDYWTEPYKLQKQVDFLEANQDYSFCFHNSIVLNERSNASKETLLINDLDKSIFHTEDLIKQWFIPTASMVFVREKLKLPDWFSNIQSGDIALTLLLSLNGPAKYLNDVMSVYRLHPNGLSNTHIGYDKFISMCYLYQTFNIHTNYKFNDKIAREIKYEFERHFLGSEKEKMAEDELKKLIRSTEYLSSKISFRQALVLLLYKLKMGRIYKMMRKGLKS